MKDIHGIMSDPPDRQDLWEFTLFCRNATDVQLSEIWRRETDNRRPRYADIAAAEIERRRLSRN
jgi:hypothetical protein